ncbi:hypothetical protein CR513_57982, partial [Mucuna pruriens]
MEDEMSRKGSTLILGRPFLMTVRMKIDVYARTLSMEFRDNLVQFNIFKAMKHPLEDHSLYSIDMINVLVEEFTQLDSSSDNMSPFVEISNVFPCAKPLHAFDPEIERTLHRLSKARLTITLDSNSSNSIWNSENRNFTTKDSNLFEHQEAGSMENNDRTLKELATPDVVYQPWYIQCLPLEPAQSEDPHKHLKEFHVVCSTMRPQGILEDHIKMKVFPFSLDGAAKDWLYLQSVLFNTWGDMKRMFLEKFFPVSRTMTIRKEICGIRQHPGETLHEYWERFNKLCTTCPHHQINEQLLIQYFYEGLMMMDLSMIDAASGGALMDKTSTAVRHLILNMANNTGTIAPKMVNEAGTIDNPRLENQLTKMTSLVRQLGIGQYQPIVVVQSSSKP